VNKAPSKFARIGSLILIISICSGCGLPSTGPNKRQILSGSEDKKGNALIVEIDDHVNKMTVTELISGFDPHFKKKSKIGADMIHPGDTLDLTIRENVDDQLLGKLGPTTLQTIQVDGECYFFVPYAGRLKAAGNTPETVRNIITQKLAEQTPDPQVEVQRIAGNGATVSLMGSVGAQGIYPIERPTRTLSAMIATAGGMTIPPEVAQITLIRGKTKGKIWLQDLYKRPELDIAMRTGDQILIEEDTRSFTALGATGTQARVRFKVQALSAVEALA
jgi:polysaccharide export outer membrane protein